MTVRRIIHESFPFRCSAIHPRHIGFYPAFIKENETFWINRNTFIGECLALLKDVRPLLLFRIQRFF